MQFTVSSSEHEILHKIGWIECVNPLSNLIYKNGNLFCKIHLKKKIPFSIWDSKFHHHIIHIRIEAITRKDVLASSSLKNLYISNPIR